MLPLAIFLAIFSLLDPINGEENKGPFKNFDERVRYYKIALLEKPEDVSLNLAYARVYFDRKNYSDTALWIYQKILKDLDPTNFEAHFLSGVIYCQKEQYYFQKLKKYRHVKITPERFSEILNKTSLNWRLGHPDQIILDYLHHSEQTPGQKIQFVRQYLLKFAEEFFSTCKRLNPGFSGLKPYLDYLHGRKIELTDHSSS